MESAPVFEEFEPGSDCDCLGCIQWRRLGAHALPVRLGGHPAAHGARRALVLAAAAGSVLGPGQAVAAPDAPHAPHAPEAPHAPHVEGAGLRGALPLTPAADDPDTPQAGARAPLHGSPGAPAAARTTTRAEIIKRAKKWVAAKVPYSMDKYWPDGYRQDCSGFVSMAWNLGGNEWTGSLDKFAVRISREELQPGDILLFHNPANPEKGSHVTLFGGWTDYTRTYYIAYEQARPYARKQATPYAYWNNGDRYLAYRYKGVKGGGSSGPAQGAATPYPGTRSFGPGANNKYVTLLGKKLIARGAGRYYRSGPGPHWSEADRAATRAFQRAQGWTGASADGIPGPSTWSYLMRGTGRDVPGGKGGQGGKGVAGGSGGKSAGGGGAHGATAYPGAGHFRPEQSNAWVERLGRQLVKKGFGKHYAQGPGPRWSESDRRGVEAFQRAQGWRGAAADGYPGPETWRRLFS
ncbi:peptidoglycan-binding protein [Streptomyces sp. NPDC059009]|uniref:peptidoglycan-binding protein n=1 Tax=Streptomyces sp. NPDC059009 TaxID=3346694 RepID=UPI0036A050EB